MENWFDKLLETGGTIATKYFDWGIANEQSKANEAARAAEQARLEQLYEVTNYQTSEVMGVSVPSWVIPAGIAGLLAVFLLKKK